MGRLMKELVWDDVLCVDVDEIDDNHRKLMGIVNSLSRAMADDVSLNYLEAILDDLINFTAYHFSHEERLMLKYGYQGYEHHKVQHTGLIGSAKKVRQGILQMEETAATQEFEFLEGWLTEHILADERALSSFLIEVM